jgi:60 kDa SS-A/Ro ribonucleoprotein
MPVPDVPMAMLTGLPLTPRQWTEIALRSSWTTTRMNLNTFERHGVFEDPEAVAAIAARLADERLVRAAKAMPYQLLVAVRNAVSAPPKIRAALETALEHATRNVTTFAARHVWVLPDVSGSMHSPITGHRKGSTTEVRCVDVAALMAATVLRKNPHARVLPFSDEAVEVSIDPERSVLANADVLAALPSGGTNCSAPLARINKSKAPADLVIFVSDNESWIDSSSWALLTATETLRQWSILRQRNPGARLVCIDLVPNRTIQAPDRRDILNLGGFSDEIFESIAAFVSGADSRSWVERIRSIEL